jgi:hypothetical protein
MNTLFGGEVYIRLTDDEAGFVCTVKRGQLYVKATEYALDGQPLTSASDENAGTGEKTILTPGCV